MREFFFGGLISNVFRKAQYRASEYICPFPFSYLQGGKVIVIGAVFWIGY